jgi:hypothetical protein
MSLGEGLAECAFSLSPLVSLHPSPPSLPLSLRPSSSLLWKCGTVDSVGYGLTLSSSNCRTCDVTVKALVEGTMYQDLLSYFLDIGSMPRRQWNRPPYEFHSAGVDVYKNISRDHKQTQLPRAVRFMQEDGIFRAYLSSSSVTLLSSRRRCCLPLFGSLLLFTDDSSCLCSSPPLPLYHRQVHHVLNSPTLRRRRRRNHEPVLPSRPQQRHLGASHRQAFRRPEAQPSVASTSAPP